MQRLANSMFGQFNVWPIQCLANLVFGGLNVWSNQCLADIRFGQFCLADSLFDQINVWPTLYLANLVFCGLNVFPFEYSLDSLKWRLSTIDLLIKVVCFVTQVNTILCKKN